LKRIKRECDTVPCTLLSRIHSRAC
jgi:hypothetical protein